MRTLLLALSAVIVLGLSPAQAFMGLFGNGMTPVRAEKGQVVLETADLGNAQAKHYTYTEGKTGIRFFLVRDNQGTVRAAFDACEQCWRADKGYALQGGGMRCINCGMLFALNRIGLVRGGCNPHPLAFTLEQGTFRVSVQELLAGAAYFPGNKP